MVFEGLLENTVVVEGLLENTVVFEGLLEITVVFHPMNRLEHHGLVGSS